MRKISIAKNDAAWGKKLEIVASDLGIIASADPVAVDQASLDLIRKKENKKLFSGDYILSYAEKIGLGRRKYSLIR